MAKYNIILFGEFLIFSMFIIYASCQTQQFSASVAISNDPTMSTGSVLNANIYYDPVTQRIRFDYPNITDPTSGKPGFKEYYDYKNNILIQLCNVCTKYTYLASLPNFFKESTDIQPSTNNKIPFSLNGATCFPYQKINPPTDGVKYIWVTNAGIPCRAEKVDGTTYDFNNVKIGTLDSATFTLPAGNNCPEQPKCGSPIDLVLVLDESGSITRKEWSQMIGFALGIVNSFVIGPNDTQIGLVYFSGVQYQNGENPASCCGLSDPALPLSFSNDTIYKFLQTHQQTGGHTCINCGIKSATTYEPNRNRPIQVPKIMLILTDGFNNRMTDFFNIDIANARDQGWNMFAIGVRNASVAQLQKIASKPEQFFFIDDFNGLALIANTVKERLCGAFPNLSPCGTLCGGKCACGGKCVCPDTCQAKDKCSTGTCVTGVSESQCLFTKKFCDPSGDLCKINDCNPATGQCALTNKNCTALSPDPCYTPSCDPKVGCTLTDNCPPIQNVPGTNKQSLCYTRTCENGKCSQTTRNCTSPNACSVQSCDPVMGCVSSIINCDDGNRCTTDTCDPYLGCQNKQISCPSAEFFNSTTYKSNPNAFNCLTYTCDPKVGCVSTNKTCDDKNLCTTDTCNPSSGACVNTPIVCPPSTDKCVVTSCDPAAGCLTTKKNCDDNNFCTTDTCNPSSGACVNTPIVCPGNPADTCSSFVCDNKARGCVAIPKLTCDQPTDKCQKSTCANGACTTTVFNCPPPDLCSTTICSSTAGCQSVTKICDDKNSCTIDSCDLTTGGCVFTPIPGCNNKTCTNCVSTNPCAPSKCENGVCVTTPVTCPVNKCATTTPTPQNGVCVCVPSNPINCTAPKGVCGESVCDPATGICGTINNRVCDDNNPCTTDVCAIVNGKATCSYTAKVCGGDSPCSRTVCKNVNGTASCVADPSQNNVNCTANGCSNATCNPTTGQCQFTTVTCPSNSGNTTCTRQICDAVQGKCVLTIGGTCPVTDPIGCGKDGVCVLIDLAPTCKYQTNCPGVDDGCVLINCKNTGNSSSCQTTNFNCDDNNPCTNEKCQADGVDDKGKPKSKCITTPFVCPPASSPCQLNLCQNQNGKPVCVLTDITCNATSKCLTGKCVVENGKGVCKYNETNCGVSDKCANFVCDPKNGCQKILKCNDNNPCTDDLCDAKTGNCTFVNKVCNSTNLCRKGVCDPNIGCVQQPVECANVTGLDACHFAVCVNTTGCQIAVIPNTLDACGFCNKPGKCAIIRKSPIPAGAIAGAVIGGAVVAGIAALAIGLFAGAGGSVAPTPGSDLGLVGGDNNPLYCEGDNTGTNPFEGTNDGDYVPL